MLSPGQGQGYPHELAGNDTGAQDNNSPHEKRPTQVQVLIAEGMNEKKGHQQISQALQKLPPFAFEITQRGVIGNRQQQEQEERGKKAGIIAQAKNRGKRCVAPGSLAQKIQENQTIVDSASQDEQDMQTSHDPGPDANIASDINVHRVAAPAQQAERTNQQTHAGQNQAEIPQ